MLKEPKKKKNVVRHISSCIIEKYNGYQAISIEFARKETKKFKPIDKIFKPTKNPEKKVRFAILLNIFQKLTIICIV